MVAMQCLVTSMIWGLMQDCVYFSFFTCVFFFQAEDGIRDFCLSRGLGDVYKRQGINAEYMGDIQELYDFIDNFADLLFLEFSAEKKIYQPRSKDWVKVQCFNYLKSQTLSLIHI
eukprot:TRINITY_DN5227_c0_g1_i3.p2 TRINITY_DN5227_c0_g1~~TRINITY_DN5227_c0_g1_i3.p2  ORF type:complete len:115 (-),score=24.71 TRINITY_DN5227_c0_g1_i3:117-461(-)